MHDLQLVGFTTDRRGLIFRTQDGTRAEASFVVPVTEELVSLINQLGEDQTSDVDAAADSEAAAVEADALAPPTSRPRSLLSVRDIQARLRSGEPVSRIATEAGVEEEWIERFAPPIRAEQQRVVERALGLHLERARSAPSAVPLRRAVGVALADKGIAFTVAAYEAAWSARLLGHDRWAVEFTYHHRGRDRTATWAYDADADVLTTSDRAAAQLGYVAPGTVADGAGEAMDGIVGDPTATASRTAVPHGDEPSAAAAAARTSSSTKKRTAKKGPVTTKKPAAKKAVAKKSASKKSAAKKTGSKKSAAEKSAPKGSAATKQAPVPEPVERQATPATEPATPPAHRLPDEPSPPATDPVREDPPSEPVAHRRVAGRPGEVPMAEVPLARRPHQDPGTNGRPPEQRPAQGERPQPAAGGDGTDPTSARRARAAARNTPTVHFRSGSAAPVRAAGDVSGNGKPGSDETDQPRPERGDPDGAAQPASRRRRQLRAR